MLAETLKNGFLGSAQTGLKCVRVRQPELERHVGVAWLCCYAAYKLSCAQLIPTSTTRTLLFWYATIFVTIDETAERRHPY